MLALYRWLPGAVKFAIVEGSWRDESGHDPTIGVASRYGSDGEQRLRVVRSGMVPAG
jgi:hypothetical protein